MTTYNTTSLLASKHFNTAQHIFLVDIKLMAMMKKGQMKKKTGDD